jgi:exonuclease SbcC
MRRSLDKVMNALEKLHDRNRMVGVISHVKELKERLPRYLEVVAAGEDGSGSKVV